MHEIERLARIVALIPARAGSKGLQRKNLAEISGESLVHRAVRIALEAKITKDVIVSSDGEEILQEAVRAGAVPHKRPKKFASDNSTAEDVVEDFLSCFSDSLCLSEDDWVLYLQPTSPLRDVNLIQQSVNLAIMSSRPVISVSKSLSHPMKSIKVISGVVKPYVDNATPSQNRQLLEPAYYADGNVFIFRIRDYLEKKQFPIFDSLPFFTPEGYGWDVDNEIDLEIVKLLLNIKDKLN